MGFRNLFEGINDKIVEIDGEKCKDCDKKIEEGYEDIAKKVSDAINNITTECTIDFDPKTNIMTVQFGEEKVEEDMQDTLQNVAAGVATNLATQALMGAL